MRSGLLMVSAAIAVTAVIGSTQADTSAPRRIPAPTVSGTGPPAAGQQPVASSCPRGGREVSPRCRWYSPQSPFNTPIPAGAAVDPNSKLMIQRMVDSLGSFYIAVTRWTVPVFYAGPRAKRYSIRMTEWGLTAYGVPVPPNARPSAPFPPAPTDGQMVVFDASTGCEYDFLEARRLAAGGWGTRLVSRIETNSSGIFRRGASARGSGFALGAGLIRPEELNAGAIRHALVFELPTTYVKGSGPVRPATESDGQSSLLGALPEGARVRLDPSFNVSTLRQPWERTIARALQRYGMYLADRGDGGVGLYAQNRESYPRNPYPWGDGDYVDLPSEMVSHMRVLKLPPQSTPTVVILPSRCGTIR